MKKKLISLLIILLSVATVTGLALAADTEMDKSTLVQGFSDGYSYVVKKDRIYITEYNTSENKIRKLEIPSTIDDKPVVHIKDGAFKNIPMVELIIPESVVTIGESAFYNCQLLEQVSINNKTISTNAFNSCKKLDTVILGEKVKNIGDYAFMNTAIETISIPANTDNIGTNVFANCTRLSHINVDSENKAYVSKDGILYTKNMKELLECPADIQGDQNNSITIPTNVKVIKEGAFYGNRNLETVSLPNTLKKIEKLGFYNAKSLKNVTIPKSVKMIENEAFSENMSLETLDIKGNTEIGKRTFADLTTLKKVSIAGGKTNIASFEGCTGLTTVVLGNKVNSLGARTFKNCSSLKEINLPDNITNLYTSVLEGCTSIEKLNLNNVSHINKRALAGCTALKKVVTNTYNLSQYNIDKTAFKKTKNVTLVGPYNCGLVYFGRNNNIKYKEVSQQ